MSAVGRSTSKVLNDDSRYPESPPQARFQSMFTPEEGERVIKGSDQSRARSHKEELDDKIWRPKVIEEFGEGRAYFAMNIGGTWEQVYANLKACEQQKEVVGLPNVVEEVALRSVYIPPLWTPPPIGYSISKYGAEVAKTDPKVPTLYLRDPTQRTATRSDERFL